MATRRKAPTKFDKEAFLDAYYENGGYLNQAAASVGAYTSTVQYHRQHNAKFAREMKAIEDELWLERSQAAEATMEEVETGALRGTRYKKQVSHFTPRHKDWKPHFLRCLAINGCVTHACVAAGISPRTAYKARQADEDFAVEWHDAIEHSTDSLEAEGIRRALGTSDLLLLFFLKARRPHIYRENAGIWQEKLDEQHMASIVDAVQNAAFKAGIGSDEFESFREELANELQKREKAGA